MRPQAGSYRGRMDVNKTILKFGYPDTLIADYSS